MNKTERIYLHKEDVWAQGDHWMTSASRDIFEHFYKAIRNTFVVRYKDPKILELAEQILHQREWVSHCFRLISEAAKTKTIPLLPGYNSGRVKFPEEIEYFKNQEKSHIQTELDFDPVIYKDFDHFFQKANHGYGSEAESRKIVFDLYFNFMKPYSEQMLINQLQVEYQENIDFLNEMMEQLKDFNNQTEITKFHKFALRK